jgi:hypothetical protein
MTDWLTWLQRGAAVAITGIGLWMIIQGIGRALFRNREESWKAVEGTVTQSVIEEDRGGESTTFRARIEYTYRVGHITFIGDRVAPLQRLIRTRWAAEQLVGRYGLGRNIKVYFNPRNPGQSVLEPGRQIPTAIGLVAFGAVVCYMAWRWLQTT